MKIFIGNDCKCYANAAVGRREFDAEFFDGKCSAFVEGYRYVPVGETWTRADGAVFAGEMISPWKDYNILAAAQAAYEQAQSESADMQAALEVLGVTNEEETT
ncbi:MAG: hypothetical protein KIG37_07725 [Oscillospiraceae bacterium]|nr:hypothetical protein [Oscillospiraceae bacterium]